MERRAGRSQVIREPDRVPDALRKEMARLAMTGSNVRTRTDVEKIYNPNVQVHVQPAST